MNSDPLLKNEFKDPMTCANVLPKLRQMLVKSDLRPVKNTAFLDPPPGNYWCGSCTQYNFTYKCTTYTHLITGKNMKVRGTISCSTRNVIYFIKCLCGLAYVGKTQRALKTRTAEPRISLTWWQCIFLYLLFSMYYIEFLIVKSF